MDFYANDSLGAWTVNNEVHRPQRQRKPRTIIKKELKEKTEGQTSGCLKNSECCNSNNQGKLDNSATLNCDNNVTENKS